MDNAITYIPILRLLVCFIFILLIGFIYFRWTQNAATIFYGTTRMIAQLFLVGFVLNAIFLNKNAVIVSLILLFMLVMATWISLRPIKADRMKLYGRTFVSIVGGAGFSLALVIFGVLKLSPWYEPRYLIPIAGMIFASAMNSVSLAAERFASEQARGQTYKQARAISFQASLLPILNSFFAVGIVSLPGMMTGQILAGISPHIAVRYQIMVMSMLLGSGGLASACYLWLAKPAFIEKARTSE